MARRGGKGGRKGGRKGSKGGRKGGPKSTHIPLKILENRLGKLSTIVAKRGGKLPKTYT